VEEWPDVLKEQNDLTRQVKDYEHLIKEGRMKFSKIRTLEHFLKEYGMTPGPATPSGAQTSGSVAKANSVAKSTTQQSQLNKPANSPTLQPATPGLTEPTKFTNIKAKTLSVNDEVLDQQGNTGGKVVSKIGSQPNPEQVVVKTTAGEYQLIDPEQELPIEESKALNYLTRNKKRKSAMSKKIKHLARRKNLHEQGKEQLFELNFNTRDVIEQALNAPIKCGFEAETHWSGMSGRDSDNEIESWQECVDRTRDEYGGSYVDAMEESYREWIYEDIIFEYESEVIQELVDERKEDEDNLDNFIDSQGGPTSEAIEQYKDDFKFNDPQEYRNRIEDGWEYMNWVREYVEENDEDEYLEWLAEDIRESGEAWEDAYNRATDDNTHEDWVNKAYDYGYSSMMEDHDIYISGGEGGLEEVENEISSWVYNNSDYTNIETGDYHSGGINNDYWRIEDDSSIEGGGLGAEIISPVYQTPRAMLEEMKGLFEELEDKPTDTNYSCGLHVTMSFDPKRNGDDRPVSAETNKVKLAVLLGDKYLLQTFGREKNSYAKSQYKNLQRKAEELKSDPTNLKTISAIEEILKDGIDTGKFNTIHFKENQRDNESGYKLIEFRVGGGDDYHLDMPKIVKAVVRYATTLQASYTDDYNKDYIRALFKLINNIGKIDDRSQEQSKKGGGRFNDTLFDQPVVDVLKGFFSKEHYLDSIEYLQRAYRSLEDSELTASNKNTSGNKYLRHSADDLIQVARQDYKIFNDMMANGINDYLALGETNNLTRFLNSTENSQELKDNVLQTIWLSNEPASSIDGPITVQDAISIAKPRSNESVQESYTTHRQQMGSSFGRLSAEEQAPLFLEDAQQYFVRALQQAGYDLNQNLNREVVNAKSIGIIRNALKDFKLTFDDVSTIILTSLKDVKETKREFSTEETLHGRVKNGVERLLKKEDAIKEPSFLTPQMAEKLITGIWNVSNTPKKPPVALSRMLSTLLVDKTSGFGTMDVLAPYLAGEYKDEQTYSKLYSTLMSENIMSIGQIIDKKLYDKSIDALSKYPTWPHAERSKKGKPDTTDTRVWGEPDSYATSYINTLKSKMGQRINTLLKMPEEELKPIQKELSKLALKVILELHKPNEEEGGPWPVSIPNIEKIIPQKSHDSLTRFSDTVGWPNELLCVTDSQMQKTVEVFKNLDTDTPFYNFASWYRDHIFECTLEVIKSYEQYKNDHPEVAKVPEIKKITDTNFKALKKFLTGFDKVFQAQGFSDLKAEISGKNVLDKREKDYSQSEIALLKGDKKAVVMLPGGTADSDTNTELYATGPMANQIETELAKLEVSKVMPSEKFFNLFKGAGTPNWTATKTLKLVRDRDLELASLALSQEQSGRKLTPWRKGVIERIYKEFAERYGIDFKVFGKSVKKVSTSTLKKLEILVVKSPFDNLGQPLLRKKELVYKIEDPWQDFYDFELDGTDTTDNAPANQSMDFAKPSEAKLNKAKGRHGVLVNMIDNGIENYMPVSKFPQLITFLVDDTVSTPFEKSHVLLAMYEANDPDTYDLNDLLIHVRSNMESRINSSMPKVFEKFEKLTLQQQLDLLENVNSDKINKVAKGFQHPNKSGKKLKAVEGAVPDNTTTRMIKKLLSDEMPAWDIKKQMDAYFIVPVPQMISDFRQRRALDGDNVCLRSIFRNYLKDQVDPSVLKGIDLKEGILKENIIDKERLQYIIDTLKAYPDFIKKVYRYIRIDPDHDGKIDPAELLSKERTQPETDHLATKEITKAFIDALMKTPGDLDDLEAFLQTYGKVSYIDTTKLMSGKTSWDEWIHGAGDVSKEFIEALYMNLFNFTPNVANSDRGPGELGLALLSPNIKIASVGDISVDGVEVEVKGERSTGGGRLRNSNDDFGHPNLDAIFNKHNVPEHLRVSNVSGNAKPQKAHFLDIAKQLEEFKVGVGKEYIAELINATYIYADESMRTAMINNALTNDYATNFLSIAKIAFNNYANILKGKGFEDILMINGPYRNSLAFKASDVDKNIQNFKFSSLDFGDARNGGAIQVSMSR
jgi:hypothetical protein